MCPELTSLEHSPNAFKPDYRVVWACGFLDEDASPSFHRGSEVNFGVFCYERYHCARKVVGRELTLLIICYHLCIRSAEEVCHTVVRKAFVKALCIESYDTRIADDRVIVLEVFRNADMYSKYVDYQHKQQDKLPEHLRMAIDRWRVRRCVSNWGASLLLPIGLGFDCRASGRLLAGRGAQRAPSLSWRRYCVVSGHGTEK